MVLNHQDADDLTQEIMIKAVRGFDGFEEQASEFTWITRIALNTTYTFLKKRKRQSTEPLLCDAAVDSENRSPEHHVLARELDIQLHNSLQRLSPKLRAAISLTAIDELTAAEAAQVEECSLSAMYSRIHEAKKQLRNCLAEYLNDGDDS